jgi:hypothetical protein
MNSQRLDPRTSLVEWRLLVDSTFSVELKKKSLSSFGLLLATRDGYPHVSQSDVHSLMGILERKEQAEARKPERAREQATARKPLASL